MFPDCAKLYIAPISESQCYDERYLFYFQTFLSLTSIT